MTKTIDFIESKGDVHFYKNEKGELLQQLGSGPLFKVKDGAMTYQTIDTKQGYTVKYNNNAVHGFSVWQGGKCLNDNFWTYNDANNCRLSFIRDL
jgi:hypothetical protein